MSGGSAVRAARPVGLRLTDDEAWELWKTLDMVIGSDHCTPEVVKDVEKRLRKKLFGRG